MDHKLEIILAARDATKSAFMSATGHVKAFTKNVFSLRGAMVVTAGAAAMGALVKKSLETADAIGKAADSIGISTDALQEYRHAARISGVETASLDKSIQQFAKRVGEAKAGTGAMITYLKKFDEQLLSNIQKSKSTDEALDLVFRRMGQTASATDKAALANAAFGRSGITMVNMVKDGAEGLIRLRQEARDLGIVMDEQLIRQSEKANDEIEKLTRVIKVQFMSAAVGLAPEIAKVAQATTDWWKANQDLVHVKVGEYAEKIKKALEEIWGIIQYDPAILEWGIVGLAIGGKKWGVIAAGMGHMATWAGNLSKALAMASQGILEYSEVAKANFSELDELVKKGEGRMSQAIGKIGPRTKGYEIYQPPAPTPTPPPAIKAGAKDWDKYWKEYWGGQKGKVEMSKALAATTENAHEEWRLRTKYSEATAADIAKHEKLMADFRKARMDESKQAFEEMFSDLRFQSADYYDYRKAQLEKQAEDYEKYSGDEVLAYQWLTEQLKTLDEERLEAAKNNNQYLVELSERTSDAMEENFSSFFKDFFRGELDSAGDYFSAFCDSLADSFADMLGQMTKELLFGGGSAGGSGLFGSLFSAGIGGLFGGGTGDLGPPTETGILGGTTAYKFHQGGIVGQDATPVRHVPASLFAHAPRFHKGLAPDEFPAILQVGERVIPRGESSVSNIKNTSISVPVIVESVGDRRLSARLQREVERTVKDIMREEMR